MNILLPIETINREIDFKIILGAKLSGLGCKVFIGQHDFLMSLLNQMDGGIYIGKNIFPKKAIEENGELYYQLKRKNFDIIYLHEEGGVFAGDDIQWKKTIQGQYNPALFDHKDRLCVWGEFQKKFDKSRSKNVPIYVVGHPRFDLYKPRFRGFYQEEVERIQNKYGKYILINGNYSMANHGKGLKNTFTESIHLEEIEERLKRVHYYKYFTSQMVAMVELTHILAAKFPELNFIYRPHPSEDHQYYQVVFNGVSNIMVKHEGPVNPWILGAKALIHDGCTTAIEASIAGIPVINFKPLFDPVCDIWLANSMGRKASSVEEIREFFNNPDVTAKNNLEGLDPMANELLFNFQGDSFSALESIIMEKIEEKRLEKTTSPNKNFIQYRFAKIKTKIVGQKMLQPNKSKTIQYHNTKFYGFDPRVIKSKIERVELLLGNKLFWTYYNSNLITIDQ